ncbi:hypothetical protein HY008_02960 [Candidatus Woesebacteria bacterium]|nr:hypothetical protein [Candidatus Woesebacteria bacterium]
MERFVECPIDGHKCKLKDCRKRNAAKEAPLCLEVIGMIGLRDKADATLERILYGGRINLVDTIKESSTRIELGIAVEKLKVDPQKFLSYFNKFMSLRQRAIFDVPELPDS